MTKGKKRHERKIIQETKDRERGMRENAGSMERSEKEEEEKEEEEKEEEEEEKEDWSL